MATNRKKNINCAIIGFGARGISFYERINAYARRYISSVHINLTIFDPNEHGCGSHSPRQADYLLVNTVASQMTMFLDKTCEVSGPYTNGPSFAQWAKDAGIRKIGSNFYHMAEDSDVGAPIDDNDYLSRAELGNYLQFVVDLLTANRPRNVDVSIIRSHVIDIKPLSEREFIIVVDGDYKQSCEFIFITTGHGTNILTENEQQKIDFVSSNRHKNPNLGFIRSPYPLSMMESISPDARVLVQGMGLTAHDVIAELTVGRGGRYKENRGRLEYIPSGREPIISLFSRQGLPFSSRAINEKGVSEAYTAEFFTLDYFKSLRQEKKKFDFFEDVLPVLKKEMLRAYYHAVGKTTCIDYEDFRKIDEILYPLQDIVFKKAVDYKRYIYEFLEDDLKNAYAGNVSGSVKAAADVLRDVRDTMRYCVEWGGLTPESHARFVRDFVPIMNRIAVGPPLVRNRQLLALIDSGLLRIDLGPSPILEIDEKNSVFRIVGTFLEEITTQVADVVIQARIDPFDINLERSPLIRNLFSKGFLTEYVNGNYHTGGLNIDRNYNIIDLNGGVRKNVWSLGNPVEGPCFFTFVLPRPGVNSRFLLDSDKCIQQMFNEIEVNYVTSR